MLWFLGQVGPDSMIGWLVLIFVAYLPVLVLAVLVVAVVVAIARATILRAPPSETPAAASTDPADPEAMAAYLLDRARDRRGAGRGSDQD